MARRAKRQERAGHNGKRRKNAVQGANGKAPKRKSGTVARAAKIDIGVDALKHLVKPPGDYHAVARRFADEMEATGFRGTVTPRQLRILVRRGEELAQRATAARNRATVLDRRRSQQVSQAWTRLLESWRLVKAALPVRPELQAPFAFMKEYMSNSRTAPETPSAPPPATAPTPPARG